LQDEKGAHRREHDSCGGLIEAARAGDEGLATEPIDVNETVIRFIRFAERREPRRLGPPIEKRPNRRRAADRGAVTAAHELGQGVHNDVGAVLDRPQEDGRGHRIVDNQRNPMHMGQARKRLDVADVAGRIADGFTEHRAAGLVDLLPNDTTIWPFRRCCSDTYGEPSSGAKCNPLCH
jgi:hypothetical protein